MSLSLDSKSITYTRARTHTHTHTHTALPLHFVDSGWPLWQLSLLLTLIYVPRVAMTLITRRAGDWICVPISAIATALNVVMLLHPTSLAAVWLAVSVTCASLNPPAYRSLVYSHFRASGEPQVQRALRIFTLSDTLGYACASFVGGLLYDNGAHTCTHPHVRAAPIPSASHIP